MRCWHSYYPLLMKHSEALYINGHYEYLHLFSLVKELILGLFKMKNSNKNSSIVSHKLLSIGLVALLSTGSVYSVFAADSGSQTKTPSADQVTHLIRAELTRAKQSIAFAENLQKEAEHDPQDIYASIKDALAIVDKLLSTHSLNPDTRAKLNSVKKGILKINANVNDTAAYAEVRGLLEPITDNPGE